MASTCLRLWFTEVSSSMEQVGWVLKGVYTDNALEQVDWALKGVYTNNAFEQQCRDNVSSSCKPIQQTIKH